MLNLSEIRERADKATPLPEFDPVDDYWRENIPQDQEFVIHARADVPALCDEVERLRGQLAEALAILAALEALPHGDSADLIWARYEKLLEEVGE